MRGLIRVLFLLLAGVSVFSINGVGVSASDGFIVSGITPPADTPVIPWTRFSVQYAVRVMGNEAPTGIYFYITNDGGSSWALLGEDPDMQSPMLVTVPGEGTYGFITVITTQNRAPAVPRSGSRPEKFVIIDRTPPGVTWISPNPGTGDAALGADGGILLEWDVRDPHLSSAPVTIEYSTDGVLWLPVRHNLAAVGTLSWTPPLLTIEEVQLRLTAKDLAGNQRTVKNRARVKVDRQPPQVTIIGPEMAGQGEVEITFTATDESGIANMELYYTSDAGNSWILFGPISQSPARFTTPTGEAVGLYIAAADRKGNRLPAPRPGDAPMRIVVLDNTPPQVQLTAPFNTVGTVIDSNSPTAIRWNTIETAPQENSGLLEYSLDGGGAWYLIAQNLPVSGVFDWTPQMEARSVLARITVADRFGNRGQAISQFFGISADRPTTNITDVAPVNSGYTPTLGGNQAEVLTNDPAFATNGLFDNPADRNTNRSTANNNTNTAAPIPTPSNSANNASDVLDIPMPTNSGNFVETPDIPVPSEVGIANDQTDVTARVPLSAIPPQEIPDETTDPFTTLPPIPGIGDIPSLNDGSNDIPSIGTPEAPNTTGLNTIDAAALRNVNTNNASSNSLEDFLPPDITAIADTSRNAAADLANSAVNAANNASDGLSNAVAIPSNPLPLNNAIGQISNTAAATPLDAAGRIAVNETLAQAETALTAKRWEESGRLAQTVLAADPNNTVALAILAQARTNQGNFREAINYASSATRYAPDNLGYLEILSYAKYAEANRLQVALRDGSIAPNEQQAVGTEIIQLLNDAETAYLQLSLAPDDNQKKSAFFRLGQIEYFRGTKILTEEAASSASIRKAIGYYEKALEIGEPDYREVLQIGICNYRLLDYEKAEISLERAIETAANAPEPVVPKEAYYYLASIHEKLDRPQQALEFWQKVVENYPPDNLYNQAARRRIEELNNLGKN